MQTQIRTVVYGCNTITAPQRNQNETMRVDRPREECSQLSSRTSCTREEDYRVGTCAFLGRIRGLIDPLRLSSHPEEGDGRERWGSAKEEGDTGGGEGELIS